AASTCWRQSGQRLTVVLSRRSPPVNPKRRTTPSASRACRDVRSSSRRWCRGDVGGVSRMRSRDLRGSGKVTGSFHDERRETVEPAAVPRRDGFETGEEGAHLAGGKDEIRLRLGPAVELQRGRGLAARQEVEDRIA